MAEEKKRLVDKLEPVSKIPRNPNSIQNGLEDPTPEKGDAGKGWRAWWSWVKGWGRGN